jgi:hypothetical protein
MSDWKAAAQQLEVEVLGEARHERKLLLLP